MNIRWVVAGLALALWSVPGAFAELKPLNPKADRNERWNWFVQAAYALHQKQIEGREIDTVRATGGYHRLPEFYDEEKYYDRKTGRLLSEIQRERAHPERIHSIHVLVYDGKDRPARRYSAWFLPNYREAPRATWVTLYDYRQELVAYRQFDASDTLVSENCEGRYAGRPVYISLWEEELSAAERDPKSVMTTPDYRVCFAGLPRHSAGKYATPQ